MSYGVALTINGYSALVDVVETNSGDDISEGTESYEAGTDLVYQFDVVPHPNGTYIRELVHNGNTLINLDQTDVPVTDLINTDYTLAMDNILQNHSIVVTINTATSINTIDIPSLSVSPNPTDGIVSIKNDPDVYFIKLELVDVKGEIVNIIDNPSNQVDISNIPAGTYFLRFYTKDGVATRSIIKK